MYGHETRIRERLARVYTSEAIIDHHANRIAEGALMMVDALIAVGKWTFTVEERDDLVNAYVRSYVALNPPGRTGIARTAAATWGFIRRASEWFGSK